MTNQGTAASSAMERFFTRQNAEKGIKLPLTLPDGTETTEYVVIRGVDSDIFRSKETEMLRETATRMAELEASAKERNTKVTHAERSAVIDSIELQIIACLVKEWSFEVEPTEENVIAFLREAPQIRNLINTKAGARKDFFELNAKPFANGPSENSPSKNAQKDQE